MFDLMFNTLFPVMFILVFGFIIYTMIGNVKTWNQNNHSPRLTVQAKIVSKRVNVSHHQHANAGDATGAHGFTTTTDTVYYVTFEVESGDRMELHMRGSEYGMLVEGDVGKLSFQGTRYLGFERE